MTYKLTIREDIQQALANNQAVVALESTLITHGLPYPTNKETALAMEQAVRDNGAIPATIAVLKGNITVGITEDDIERLARAPEGSVRKCSRRDLPIAIALEQDGATTVAGTMIVAHMVGIKLFATGGIGGVHRGHPQDVSADLIELGRTPIAVVCSGAKSILDLPLTLEVLETQGVPVLGYKTTVLPAFYTARTDMRIDECVQTDLEAAKIIHAIHELEAQHGVLITVPVPEAQALGDALAETAIQQAVKEADEKGISGKEVTPFVLARVKELTYGTSMTANIALLVNNAGVAARIAKELSSLRA